MSRYFTEDHEWVDVDGEIGTVGISDYAQGQLGDIVFVDVPETGVYTSRRARRPRSSNRSRLRPTSIRRCRER